MPLFVPAVIDVNVSTIVASTAKVSTIAKESSGRLEMVVVEASADATPGLSLRSKVFQVDVTAIRTTDTACPDQIADHMKSSHVQFAQGKPQPKDAKI